MSKRHEIPTVPSQYEFERGHYSSQAIILVNNSSRSGGPGGWGAGGWTEEGEGRLIEGGPQVKGPHAFLFGRCAVLSDNPRHGTGATHEQAQAEGQLFEVDEGDTVVLAGAEYTVKLSRFGYPSLELIETKGGL